MQYTSFATYVTVRRLVGLADDESLLPAFASSSISIYPYQIAAGQFTLLSSFMKGTPCGEELLVSIRRVLS